MLNKKYLPSVIVLYINYFLHGIGCSILGQALIKESLAASWDVEVMAITPISAALGLGRLIALPCRYYVHRNDGAYHLTANA